MPHEPVDLTRVRTIPLQVRPNKVSQAKFAKPPVKGQTAANFLAGLPHILAGDDFRAVVQRAACNRNAGGGIPHRFAFDDAGRELQPIHVTLVESDA